MDNRAEVLSFPQTSKTGKLPKRPKNKDIRVREYLTEQEVKMLMNSAKKTGRHGHRDANEAPREEARYRQAQHRKAEYREARRCQAAQKTTPVQNHLPAVHNQPPIQSDEIPGIFKIPGI